MSRAITVEKIVAVARIYAALLDELGIEGVIEPEWRSAILDAAVKIALASDTRDLSSSILGMDNPKRADNLDGTTPYVVTDTDDLNDAIDLAAGDHFAYPD